ncbi:MAG: tRNA (guanosine(46)-N7)-methyltransferase TrmB, partial [Hyphomicrobiales bacterium]
ISSIRLHDEDAGALLDRLPEAGLGRIYLLYPDPWPKKRHWKRRFVTRANLDRLHRALKPGGELRFATDIPSYGDWALRHIHDHGGFEWTARTADDWRKPWPGWVSTRYEQKALKAGRVPNYFIFRRR